MALVQARRYIPGTSNALLLRRPGWFPFQPAGTALTCMQQQPALGLLRIGADRHPWAVLLCADNTSSVPHA